MYYTAQHLRLHKMSKQKEHALVLGAVGDALGYVAEWNKRESVSGLKAFRARKGGRFDLYVCPVNLGDYTDDTEYTIVTAGSMRDASNIDHKRLEACVAYYSKFGTTGGRSTKKAGQAVLRRKTSLYDNVGNLFYGKGKQQHAYWEQKGSGVIMRVAPLALGIEDEENSVNAMYENGILTHGSPEALVSAVIYGHILRKLHDTQELGVLGATEEVLNAIVQPTSPMMDEWADVFEAKAGVTFQQRVEEVTRDIGRQVKALRDQVIDEPEGRRSTLEGLHLSQKADDTLIAALGFTSGWNRDPDNLLKYAANVGRDLRLDVDTVCGLVGQIAGVQRKEDTVTPLSERVQDSTYLQNVGRFLGQNRGSIELQADWREHIIAQKGLWHPLFGEATVTDEEEQERYTLRRLQFPKGKTMLIRVKKSD